MVFGLFSKERKLKRAISKATNRLAQSADRWAAMERLAGMGVWGIITDRPGHMGEVAGGARR